MWTIIFCILATIFLYISIIKPYSYWKKKGCRYVKPIYVFGNFLGTVIRTRSFVEIIDGIYNKYPKDRYVGFFQFLYPSLLIRDPKLIKRITIKDFDVFPNHRSFVSTQVDPLWAKNLFSMSIDDGWHDMRATLSPSFTSNKMKIMFGLMVQCAKQFVNHFETQNTKLTVELHDAFTRYTNDVIGSTAFGVNCNSLKDRENEFYMMGKEAVNFSGIRTLKFFGCSISPTLMKFFGVTIFNKKVSKFFRSLIKETIKIREESHIIRPDMIHLLLEARKDNLSPRSERFSQETSVKVIPRRQKAELTDDDITAQALIFFLGGFGTSSILMCYLAYELATNPDAQTNLYSEIKATLETCDGKITYEALLGMKYLDNVVSETLRLHPPTTFTDRVSVKPYTIEPENEDEQELHLDAGTSVWIPIHSFHRDPQYFPNPEKFDPERFSNENIKNIKPYTYMPFGNGPRICIGSRFALLECKLMITELLQKFELVPVEKTPIPIKFSTSSPNPVPDQGFWIGLNPRSA